MNTTPTLVERCTTNLYSDTSGHMQAEATQYLVDKMAHPDLGSEFDKKNPWLKYVLRSDWIKTHVAPRVVDWKVQGGYDALLLSLDGRIIGLTAFEIHPKEGALKAFSFQLDEAYHKQGLGNYMGEQIVAVARAKKLALARIGGGNSPITNAMHAHLCRNAERLGITPLTHNWIGILY